MVEILSRLPPGELPVVLCLGFLAVVVCVIGTVKIVAGALGRYRERKLATTLILEMLNRQMPFDQIRDVISAMDMEESLDPALSLRVRSEEVQFDSDPSNGETTESPGPTQSFPHPAALSKRSAMWLAQRAAL